jgi:hypothetical protein
MIDEITTGQRQSANLGIDPLSTLSLYHCCRVGSSKFSPNGVGGSQKHNALTLPSDSHSGMAKRVGKGDYPIGGYSKRQGS